MLPRTNHVLSDQVDIVSLCALSCSRRSRSRKRSRSPRKRRSRSREKRKRSHSKSKTSPSKKAPSKSPSPDKAEAVEKSRFARWRSVKPICLSFCFLELNDFFAVKERSVHEVDLRASALAASLLLDVVARDLATGNARVVARKCYIVPSSFQCSSFGFQGLEFC